MNQGLINRDSLRIINNSFGKYEESEDSGQNLYTNIFNIYIEREMIQPRIFFQSDVSIFALVPITLKGSNPGIFQLSRKMERFEMFTAYASGSTSCTPFIIYRASSMVDHQRPMKEGRRIIYALCRQFLAIKLADIVHVERKKRRERKKKKKREEKERTYVFI